MILFYAPLWYSHWQSWASHTYSCEHFSFSAFKSLLDGLELDFWYCSMSRALWLLLSKWSGYLQKHSCRCVLSCRRDRRLQLIDSWKLADGQIYTLSYTLALVALLLVCRRAHLCALMAVHPHKDLPLNSVQSFQAQAGIKQVTLPLHWLTCHYLNVQPSFCFGIISCQFPRAITLSVPLHFFRGQGGWA